MTPMTAAKPRRTYITEVHNSIAGKIGKEGADTLTHYLEEVIPAQIEDKIQYLATKEDVAKVRGELKEDIARLETKVAQVETKLTGLILNSQLKMEESLKGQTRWMVGILIAIFMAMLALYFKK